jgi:translation initiation factor IF-2
MSNNIRIYELSKELGKSNKEIINEAEQLGIKAKSHSSSVTPQEADFIKESFKEIESGGAAEEKPVPKKEVKQKDEKEPVPQPAEKPSEKKEEKIKEPEIEDAAENTSGKVIKLSVNMNTARLAEELEMDVTELISKYKKFNYIVTRNQRINPKATTKTLNSLGYRADFQELYGASQATDEKEERKDIRPRPPIVTVMGHVDHGKTQLLDAIRKTNIIASEQVGITQHIGASKVKIKGKGDITFIDTPGHEAFTAMRARGAQITDIVILVIAGDDGVMPQTVEAINHIKAAGVPLIVAINKSDLPEYNADHVRTQLSQHSILTEKWGGEVIDVEVSAKENNNLDELMELVLLQAEMLELKAPFDGPAKAVVIESEVDKRMGPTATVIVTEGTLKTSDSFICGATPGKIKAMTDASGKRLKKAPPSTPIRILGFEDTVRTADNLVVMNSRKKARQIAEARKEAIKSDRLATRKKITLEDLQKQLLGEESKDLKIILKTDVAGSLEAIKDALSKFDNKEVELNVMHGDVGTVTRQDIMLASSSEAIIIGFNISVSGSIKKEAETEGVQIRTYRIIYEIIEDIKNAMEGLLAPEEKEVTLGRAEALKVYNITGVGTIAGCRGINGVIQRSASARVLRDSKIVYEGALGSLKRFKDDASEVASGFECGINIANFNDIKVGDLIESFKIESRKRTLDE